MHAYLKPHLVVVEDDTDLRKSLSEYMQLRGFEVFEAASGLEFHDIVKSKQVDVAVLDVNLPDVSGLDLARFLSNRDDVGIIMLTALNGREDRRLGYDGGADLYFTKPFDSEELALAATNLVKRIRRRERPATKLSPKENRNWLLDRKRQTLSSPEGTEVSLSGKEVLLIEFLARHSEPTVPRIEMLRLFDPGNNDPFSRRLDMAFGRLRSKASHAGMDLPVQVIRGIGLRRLEIIQVV